MRLFGYYALHSFKNALKKLMKTWLVFFLACLVLGGAVGAGVAALTRKEEPEPEPEANITETAPPAEASDEIPDPEALEDLDLTGTIASPAGLLERLGLEKTDLIEAAVGLIILAVLLIEMISADKNGSKIFLPADVSLLFASPMQPQSVLMFRLGMQMGVAALGGLCMLFQLPNLIFNLGMSAFAAWMIIVTWCCTIVIGRLLQVLCYLLCAAHPGFRVKLRWGVYFLLILLAAAFVLVWRRGGAHPLRAAVDVLNAPAAQWIPIWGWLKGLVYYAAEDNVPLLLVCLVLTLLSMAALVLVIRHTRADFYEDAMAKSEETAALLEKMRSERNNSLFFRQKKKDRSERLERDGLNKGCGANVFFYRTLYNRRRFAVRGVLTKTMESYLLVACLLSLLCRFAFHSDSLSPAAIGLAVVAFFRSLGNPLEQDTCNDYFRLVPEPAARKLFWSLLGGTVCCVLDALPALLLSVILLRCNPLPAPGWLLFIGSVDFFATAVGSFIGAAVPVKGGKTVKQIIQILFLYFGLLPDAAIMIIGVMTERLWLALIAAAGLNLLLGLLFAALCGKTLDPNARKR